MAADTLAVRQKRRIYITNVLEGIGLIEKKSKNSIQWKGAECLALPQHDIDMNDIMEKQLDAHMSHVQYSIMNITNDISNQHLSYVTPEDICKCVGNNTLLVIRAPSGTQLDVAILEQSMNKKTDSSKQSVWSNQHFTGEQRRRQ